ncbi:MAG: hypothetical protein KDE56_21250 [Anaerolineales bacterium]|nr:hypothetical protein [Anaerolineales bacterium]
MIPLILNRGEIGVPTVIIFNGSQVYGRFSAKCVRKTAVTVDCTLTLLPTATIAAP